MSEEPTWIRALREACDVSTQRDIAVRIGISQGAVYQVLKGVYPASTKNIEARVREVLRDEIARLEAPPPAPTEEPWIVELRAACEIHSQRVVAERLELSTSTINQVLKGKYKASTKKVERRVRGGLMGEGVTCPVVHRISLLQCQRNQDRTTVTDGNVVNQWLWDACRGGCPNSDLKPKPKFKVFTPEMPL